MTASSVQAATPQAAVARTLVSVADIPATHRIAPADEGWQQAETITNSCSTKVTTEWFRRARDKRRVVTGAAAKPSVTADHEVVAYDAPARGALAMHEYRAMAAACPPKMTLIISGTTYDITRTTPRTDTTLPVKDNTVWSEVMTPSAKTRRASTSFHLRIVQRHGQVLSIVDGRGAIRNKEQVIRDTTAIARKTGARQAAIG